MAEADLNPHSRTSAMDDYLDKLMAAGRRYEVIEDSHRQAKEA